MKQEYILLDIESQNHLEKDCGGNQTKLRFGLAGIKVLGRDEFLFYQEKDIQDLKNLLLEAELIIGFNLVGHNGLDYRILKNYGIDTEPLLPKTYDLVTALMRTFGSYKNLSLDNVARNTLGIEKKKSKQPNYKLIQRGQLDKVKENLKHELRLIEGIFTRMVNEQMISFGTPTGFVDEHEFLNSLAGFSPEEDEDVTDPHYLAGIQLEVKDKTDIVETCSKCGKKWRIRSVCYYGDSMDEEVVCPNCSTPLCTVRSSFAPVEIDEIAAKHPKK